MDSSFTVAVHALVCLAHRGKSMKSGELASNICTNPSRVRKILSSLTNAGIVEPHEGQDGGYRLCKDASSITLESVADALRTEFVSVSWKSGDEHDGCAICRGMSGAMDGIYSEMDTLCRKYLSGITIKELEGKLTGENGK